MAKTYTRIYKQGKYTHVFTGRVPTSRQRAAGRARVAKAQSDRYYHAWKGTEIASRKGVTSASTAWKSMKGWEKRAVSRNWTPPGGAPISSTGKFRTGQAAYRSLRGKYGRQDALSRAGKSMARIAAMSVVDYALDPPRSGAGAKKPQSFRASARSFAKGMGKAALMGAGAYATRRAVRFGIRKATGAWGKGHAFMGNQYVHLGSTSRFAGRKRGGKPGQRSLTPLVGSREAKYGMGGWKATSRGSGIFRRR
jgi:hypothetical protein